MITRKYINDYYVSHIALYRLIQRFIDYTVIKHGGPLNQFWLTGSRVNNYMSHFHELKIPLRKPNWKSPLNFFYLLLTSSN